MGLSFGQFHHKYALTIRRALITSDECPFCRFIYIIPLEVESPTRSKYNIHYPITLLISSMNQIYLVDWRSRASAIYLHSCTLLRCIRSLSLLNIFNDSAAKLRIQYEPGKRNEIASLVIPLTLPKRSAHVAALFSSVSRVYHLYNNASQDVHQDD